MRCGILTDALRHITRMSQNPAFITLRKIEAAREIAATVAASANRVMLSADSLLLNLVGHLRAGGWGLPGTDDDDERWSWVGSSSASSRGAMLVLRPAAAKLLRLLSTWLPACGPSAAGRPGDHDEEALTPQRTAI